MLILHFDHPSAAATVAVLRLEALAERGAPVGFSGIDVLGLERAVPATLDQLEEYERHRDRAAALGLPLRRPTVRPPTLLAHLVGEHAEAVARGPAWRRACLAAYWRDGADLAASDTLLELARDVGLEVAAVADLFTDRAARAALRRRMLDDRRRGVGGVPVLEVDGTLVPADLSDADLQALAGL